eukprot:gnl/MRDRNA2_/MRDRNA2_62436_c0_seq1.p1 gnl/MRDRNA2_/MRDRNA2_62436_c0~~gnl/MRDRNA2_/MRDRNA2_62436_c0_seq1.p1  ORF type:complete len:199 (+),score=44.60 gnl/MRDRNA2_/MRDRNA2_62436_c0_seq1:85-681(+)
MAVQVAWVLTCMSLVARAQAAICQNWNETLCEQRSDGGCGCVWNATGSQCVKGEKCEEGMMGITSVVEPEPVEMYYNLSSPNPTAQELTVPCRACRRGLSPEQENQQAACEQADGKVALCGCLDVFCTVNVPAETLGKADDITTTDAPSGKALTEAPTGSVVDETTTNTADASVAGRATMVSNRAKIMLICGAVVLSF